MKKCILTGGAIILLTVSCTKPEKTENPDGFITKTATTVTEYGIDIDTSRIDRAKKDIDAKADEVGNKIDKAAQKTKEKLDQTGKDIKKGAQKISKDVKDAASKGAEKVEEGANKLKEDLKKK